MSIKRMNTLYRDTEQIDLTGATEDYYLQPGDMAVINFSEAISVPMHVKTVDGLYVIDILGNYSQTVGSDSPIYLLPNNTTISSTLMFYYGTAASINFATTSSNAGLEIGAGLAYRLNGTISTLTNNKSIEFSGLFKQASQVYSKRGYSVASGTTTAWTSLGTLSFPIAQSGKVIITRIV